jgi:hypothetical protein
MTENFPNSKKVLPIQVQEASRTPNRLDQNRTYPWHIIIKMSTENRDSILKAVRQKKQITYKSKPIKITENFSMETLKPRRAWSDVCQAPKENNFSPRTLYPAKLSFKIDGTIKIFQNKQKQKWYKTTKTLLQKILQGILHTVNESKHNKEVSSHKRKDNAIEGSIDSAAQNQILQQQKQLNGNTRGHE